MVFEAALQTQVLFAFARLKLASLTAMLRMTPEISGSYHDVVQCIDILIDGALLTPIHVSKFAAPKYKVTQKAKELFLSIPIKDMSATDCRELDAITNEESVVANIVQSTHQFLSQMSPFAATFIMVDDYLNTSNQHTQTTTGDTLSRMYALGLVRNSCNGTLWYALDENKHQHYNAQHERSTTQ